jgi:ABC-type multidrug transport system ATPase subunit
MVSKHRTRRTADDRRMTDVLVEQEIAAIDVGGVSRHAGGQQLLHDVTFSLGAGELVAVAGGSGAGKTTLLETMAGIHRPSAGVVRHDGAAVRPGAGGRIGYVPQDDIIHRDLPLRRTLMYAAALRLPAATTAAEAERIVDETLADLDLSARADVVVGALSGGQRKRTSIAVELLDRPSLFFLDEPTSGLDPATAAEVLVVLRRLTDRGVTVVLTTHDPADIEACDRVVFLARGGHLAFVGTPGEAKARYGVDNLARVYPLLAASADVPGTTATPSPAPAPASATRGAVGPARQWLVLTRRSAEVMVRSKLTLAVLLGSPALVTAMMAVLFQPGAFEPHGPEALGPVQLIFWLAFAGFFFGLTYGLLQIVGERAVFRRERFAGLSPAAYVLSKMTVLTPLLATVDVVLLGTLRALDRLPAFGAGVYAALFLTLLIESIAALALGLLASAAVADAAQATLALPMLCFPQVLFAGAIVPVPRMAFPGRFISAAMANRWSFESLGRVLPLDAHTAGSSVAPYHRAFAGSAVHGWLVLAASTVALLVATIRVLRAPDAGPTGRVAR